MTEEQIILMNKWRAEVWQQTGEPLYTQFISFVCFFYGEHFAAISGDPAAIKEIPAFSDDWYRYSRPCWMN